MDYYYIRPHKKTFLIKKTKEVNIYLIAASSTNDRGWEILGNVLHCTTHLNM